MIPAAATAILILAAAHAYADPGSPRQQAEAGTAPHEIVCPRGLDLVLIGDIRGACVTPGTAVKMLARGIATEVIGPTWVEPPDPAPVAEPEAVIEPERDPWRAQAGGAQVRGVPAGGTAYFYITDRDLDTGPGIDRVEAAGILVFEIGGQRIPGPDIIIETGPTTGVFLAEVEIPAGAGGVLTATYLDESGASGHPGSVTGSVRVESTFARLDDGGAPARIGREVAIRIHDADANLDSRDEDRLPLEALRFRSEGGLRTTLADPAFDAKRPYLLETGRDTGVFEVLVEIPRTVGGHTIHIGHWYEISYIDPNNPAGVPEETVLRGTIGSRPG